MAVSVCASSIGAANADASHFASGVVGYTPGTGVFAGYDDPAAALGSPTRFTAPESEFGGAVTPFNSSFGAGECVTIGEGGSLTLGFDQLITDDAANPYGVDLLIFGNSFLGIDFGTGRATGQVFSEGGVVELSADGFDWRVVPGAQADGLFPTLGYRDVTEPFPASPGSVLTDFRIPVDPSLSFAGLTTSELAQAYAGSGGGLGIDIASVGLSEVRFVRISNPFGSGLTPEIDAVSIVPAPGALAPLGLALLWRRRR